MAAIRATEDAHSRKNRGKTERLEARASAEQKGAIQRAAEIEGRSLSDFVVEYAYEAAREVIRTHEVLTLSPRDSRAFVEAVLNPPAPNGALREAFANYRQSVAQGRIVRA